MIPNEEKLIDWSGVGFRAPAQHTGAFGAQQMSDVIVRCVVCLDPRQKTMKLLGRFPCVRVERRIRIAPPAAAA